MTKKKLIEDIKARPPRFYRMPADVLRDRRFADAQRLEILRAWAADAEDDAVSRQIAAMIAELEGRAADHHAAQ